MLDVPSAHCLVEFGHMVPISMHRYGEGSNATLAIQGSSSEARVAQTPQADLSDQASAGHAVPRPLTYTWSIPAVPPSLQVMGALLLPYNSHYVAHSADDHRVMGVSSNEGQDRLILVS